MTSPHLAVPWTGPASTCQWRITNWAEFSAFKVTQCAQFRRHEIAPNIGRADVGYLRLAFTPQRVLYSLRSAAAGSTAAARRAGM